MSVYELQAVAIVIINLISAWYAHWNYIRLHRLTDLAFVLVCLYWVVIYAYVLGPWDKLDPVLFGRVFLRPAYLLMGVVVASDQIYRARIRK